MEFAIYKLTISGGTLPFYVGKTNDAARRLREHRRQYSNFSMDIIESCGDDWPEREHFWIEHYRSGGAALTNRTRGGDGCQRHGEATRRRLSAAGAGRPKPPGFGARLAGVTAGKPHAWTAEGAARAAVTQFGKGRAPTDHMTPDRNRKVSVAVSALGFDERSRRMSKAWSNLTPEQRSARGRAASAGRAMAAERRLKETAA